MKNSNQSVMNFFSCLSYMGNENTLSDLITAACNSSYLFKRMFLEFIFPNAFIMSKCPSDIEREVSINNEKVRFDLYFCIKDDTEYIIENKIYDSNDHFTEYTKLFPNEQIGFIANYDVSHIKYKNKHTWKEFYNYLNNNISLFSGDEKKVVKGLLEYIQGACGIMQERNFYLKDLRDLGFFIKKLGKILEEQGFSLNNRARGSSNDRVGYWVEKYNRAYWFGLYLNENKAEGYCIWGAIYNYELKTKSKNIYSEYDPKYKELDSIWFKLKNSYLDALSSKLDYDNKIEIIKGFIDEIENIK